MYRLLPLLPLLLVPPPGARAGSPPEPPPLELVTFNIRNGKARDGVNRWVNRRQLVIDHLRAAGADFIGLQEAYRFQVDAVAAGLKGYAWVGVGRGDHPDGGEYSPIFYRADRWAPDRREGGTFWLSDTPEVSGSITWGNACTRICTWARFVNLRTRRGVYVYNTHLDHRSQPSRERSVALILARIAARVAPVEPWVLMGDFNAGEGNPIHRSIMSAWGGRVVDAFRAAHPKATDVATFNGFRPVKGRRRGGRIDHIFVSPDLAVRAAAILRNPPGTPFISDHYAVAATVTLGPPSRPVGPPRLHSHNDYHRARPLHDALAYGAGSIEADVLLHEGELYVGHSRAEIRPGRTLEALYLAPLARMAGAGGGRLYRDAVEPIRLHVDLKTGGNTAAILHRRLARHPRLFERYTPDGRILPGPVRVLLWERYRSRLGEPKIRYVNFIAGMDRLGAGAGPADLDGHHARWGSHFRWRGVGPIPAAERTRLRALVAAAHAKGRTVRFWALPPRPALWAELAKAGVDFLNVDDLAGGYEWVATGWPRLRL